MPYKTINQLPGGVKNNLPKHAQQIYKSAFNNALDKYGDEQQAHRVAWGAVKRAYENHGDRWIKKSN